MSEDKRERNWRQLIERVGRWVWTVLGCAWRDLRAWARLQWQLAQIERRIRALAEDRDEALLDLGRAVMTQFQAGKPTDPELASRCTTVQVLEKEIETQRQEKVRLRMAGCKPAPPAAPVPAEVSPSGEEDIQPALLTVGESVHRPVLRSSDPATEGGSFSEEGSESSAGEGV